MSVVIPAYNVESYIADTLKSVLRQTFQHLEVIVVNDGSTDETLARIEKVAATDGRIRVISKVNAGLGAARNTGITASSAPFIAFVDSDDLLPAGALSLMMETIQASRSDVVVGSIERFTSRDRWVPAWVRECHDRDRIGITATELPAILWDVFACNKVFRRSSWDRLVGKFPEGILYEDQECTGKLFTGGAKFDILKQVVYSWRLREDGSSITQQKSSPRDLDDRLLVLNRMRTLMRDADEELRRYWYFKTLSDDMYWYQIAVPRANDEFWNSLSSAIAELYYECPKHVIASIPLARRLLTLAMALGTRNDFDKALLYFQETKTGGQILVRPDGSLSITAPIIGEMTFEVSAEMLEFDRRKLSGEATLREYRTGSDGSVSIAGDFKIAGWDSLAQPLTVRAELVREVSDPSTQDRIQLGVEHTYSERADVESSDALNDSSQNGFQIDITRTVLDLVSLDRTADSVNRWTVTLFVEYSGEPLLDLRITKRDSRGSAGRMVAPPLNDTHRRCAPVTLEDGALAFELFEVPIVASSVHVDGNRVLVSLDGIPSGANWQVVARSDTSGAKVVAPCAHEGKTVTAELNFAQRTSLGKANTEDWQVHVERPGSVPFLIAARTRLNQSPFGRFVVNPTGFGYLRLREQIQFGEISAVDISSDERSVTVRGTCYIDPRIRIQTPSFGLVAPTRVLRATRTEWRTDGRFEASFDLVDTDLDGREVRVESGLYIFQLLAASRQPLPASAWLQCSQNFVETLPRDVRGEKLRILLARTPQAGGLALDLRPPLKPDESGSLNQRRLIDRAYASRSRGTKAAILFESFGGRSIQDSPLAIDALIAQRRPDLTRLWTVWDHSVAVPAGAKPVLIYSREWHEAVATSQYLVNNNNFPAWFRKRRGQTYVQTWHGTPLKRIGNDVPSANLSTSYRALMKREAERYWDHLIAQSPWAANVLSAAFGFDRTVHALGYPRNDSLHPGEKSQLRRDIVRRHFGVGNEQRLVLYAPTWRDNVKDASGRYKYQLYLDQEAVSRRLGADTVFLFRGHSNTIASRTTSSALNVHEVTTFPNINDLMLAADVLVTDYSSSMFDFVVTGKPIIFLAPDLEEYRDSTRGFYFDFESRAPGPICSNSVEVAEKLDAVFSGSLSANPRYSEFCSTFAPLDDGLATERVVDAIWGG